MGASGSDCWDGLIPAVPYLPLYLLFLFLLTLFLSCRWGNDPLLPEPSPAPLPSPVPGVAAPTPEFLTGPGRISATSVPVPSPSPRPASEPLFLPPTVVPTSPAGPGPATAQSFPTVALTPTLHPVVLPTLPPPPPPLFPTPSPVPPVPTPSSLPRPTPTPASTLPPPSTPALSVQPAPTSTPVGIPTATPAAIPTPVLAPPSTPAFLPSPSPSPPPSPALAPGGQTHRWFYHGPSCPQAYSDCLDPTLKSGLYWVDLHGFEFPLSFELDREMLAQVSEDLPQQSPSRPSRFTLELVCSSSSPVARLTVYPAPDSSLAGSQLEAGIWTQGHISGEGRYLTVSLAGPNFVSFDRADALELVEGFVEAETGRNPLRFVLWVSGQGILSTWDPQGFSAAWSRLSCSSWRH